MEFHVYAKPVNETVPYSFIKLYNIKNSNVARLGPKTKQGDTLTPEGIYTLDFYPAFKWSDFYLAFKITYPNRADYIRRNFWNVITKPGGYINIHGCCVSIGCVPLGNPDIEELFFFIRNNQIKNNLIDVHLYPFKFDSPDNEKTISLYKDRNKKIYDFWENLKDIYLYFTQNKKIPKYKIDNTTGYYKIDH